MNLPSTTRARLRFYRERAAASKWSNDWRQHRWNPWRTDWHNRSEDGRKIYADERDTLGDYLGDWGTFLRGRCWDATGFYSDNWANDTIRGGVEKIRTPRGVLYVPVTYCTGWDGVTYYMSAAEIVPRGSDQEEHEKAIREACWSAYNYAESEADESREDEAKYQAEEQIASARAEIHATNKAARALLAEIRGQEFTQNVCEALRHRLREYLADRRRCFELIAEREANYWSAVSY